MKPVSEIVTTIGQTRSRHPGRPFGILQSNRLFHTYIIGQTGTGKSTLLSQLIRQYLKHGQGCCLIDPHGDLVRTVVEVAGDNVIYWDAADLPFHRWGNARSGPPNPPMTRQDCSQVPDASHRTRERKARRLAPSSAPSRASGRQSDQSASFAAESQSLLQTSRRHGSGKRFLPDSHQSSYPSCCRLLRFVTYSSMILGHRDAVWRGRQPSHLFGLTRPILPQRAPL